MSRSNHVSIQNALEIALKAFPGLTQTELTLATDELACSGGKLSEILEDAWDEVSNSITRVTILQGQGPRGLGPPIRSFGPQQAGRKKTVKIKVRFGFMFCFIILLVPTPLNSGLRIREKRSFHVRISRCTSLTKLVKALLNRNLIPC